MAKDFNATLMYHQTEKPRTVYSVEELRELGPGWYDSPKKAAAKAPKAKE